MGKEREQGLNAETCDSNDGALDSAKNAVAELGPKLFAIFAGMYSQGQAYDDLPPEVANAVANIDYRIFKGWNSSPGLSKDGKFSSDAWLRDSNVANQAVADLSVLPENIDAIRKLPRQTKHEQAAYENAVQFFLDNFKHEDEIPGLYELVRNKIKNSMRQNEKKLDLARIERAAELEDAKEQYKRAVQYIDGEVVPRDFNEAAVWLRKAAAQGYADAQYLLGIMHEGGEGATQDIQQAISYMRKAAEQGYTEAQAWLVAQERKFSAENIVTYPPAEKQTADETPLSDKGDFYSIGWLVSKQWHKLPFSKKRYYYDILDLLTGLALGQSLSKWVSTIFHGSPDASGWVAAISLALGGGVGYFLCHYTRTQFTKNMQSRSAVIFWSISIPIGLTLAIITTTVLLEKSSAQPTSDGIVDPFAPGYVAPGSNEEFLQNVTKNFQEKCAGQEGIDFLNCWADYSPKKCKSLVYGQPVNPTWARCVYSCGSAGMYSKTFGDCARR